MSAVPSYCGQTQQTQIEIPANIAYRETEREESCWTLPQYTSLFPEVPNMQIIETQPAAVPPPIYTTDLWSAHQTYPL